MRERKVYALLGVEPEVCGYALARFSRSKPNSTFRDWVFAAIESGAQWFYETFYHKYGHASIADQAHVAVILEGVSIVAAIECLYNQLLDAQERSTRYMDFSPANIVVPPELVGTQLVKEYLAVCHELIENYEEVHSAVTGFFIEEYLDQKPTNMSEVGARQILEARAFDVARGLLPHGVSTSLGFVGKGRTIEAHITYLLSQVLQEQQEIGAEIKGAVSERPAFNPVAELIGALLAKLIVHSDEEVRQIGESLKQRLHLNAVALPTLVKYAAPKSYLIETYKELEQVAAGILNGIEPDGTRGVTLIKNVQTEIDIATTLLYKVSLCSYEQIRVVVEGMRSNELAEVIALAYKHRGEHDEVICELGVGNLTFDICQDSGSCRDMFRHRNCMQIRQRLSSRLGFDVSPEIDLLGLGKLCKKALAHSGALAEKIDVSYPGVGQYPLAMAYRRRTLYRMHPAELQYITELRTGTQNHFSNREIAWQMFEVYQKVCSNHAEHFRVTPLNIVDFFGR